MFDHLKKSVATISGQQLIQAVWNKTDSIEVNFQLLLSSDQRDWLCGEGWAKHTAIPRGDFKQTINKVAQLDRYPIPRIEDLLAKLAGGKQFSKLDLSQAYQQVPLEESSQQYVVVNTHKGLFAYRIAVNTCRYGELGVVRVLVDEASAVIGIQ